MVKKVALITIQYPPTIGGLQEHIRGIAHLGELLGYDITVITAEPNPTMKMEGKTESNVIQLPVLKWFKDGPIINPLTVYETLKSINPDIVHVVYPFPIMLDVACIFGYLNHKKVCCTYIDDITVGFPVNKIYEKTCWKICKCVIDSISASSIEYSKSATGLKDWGKKIYNIPPPVFDTDFNLDLKDKYSAKKKLGLDKYDKVILFVGGLRKKLTYKRLDMLLKSWAQYNKVKQSNSVLVIIGGGELTNYYKDMAYELGLTPDNTVFKGYVSRETLIDTYLAGNMLVLPSEGTNEGFGITPVEAMLYGNAIIASDIPGIRGALKRKKAYVSLTPPLNQDAIVNELLFWLSKSLNEYSLKNHQYVKDCYSNEIIGMEIKKMYDD
ncbi:MAG: glycosyltransferase family 4 protein [Methanobacterium sp.]|jgi:glycosyltransferase involved in cell wall biosynthesis